MSINGSFHLCAKYPAVIPAILSAHIFSQSRTPNGLSASPVMCSKLYPTHLMPVASMSLAALCLSLSLSLSLSAMTGKLTKQRNHLPLLAGNVFVLLGFGYKRHYPQKACKQISQSFCVCLSSFSTLSRQRLGKNLEKVRFSVHLIS